MKADDRSAGCLMVHYNTNINEICKYFGTDDLDESIRRCYEKLLIEYYGSSNPLCRYRL